MEGRCLFPRKSPNQDQQKLGNEERIEQVESKGSGPTSFLPIPT